MYSEELQSYFNMPGRLMATLLSKIWGIRLYNFLEKFIRGRSIEELRCEELHIPSRHGSHKIRVRIFRPQNAQGKLPGMLYLHGGGYMVGNPEQFFDTIKQFFAKRPFVMIAPDYRKSLHHPFPAGFNDCYDTLLWLKENADTLGIIADQLMVAGHSSGGGLTAAVALKARDTKDAKFAFQMPIYPMIDHRQIAESAQNMNKAPMWDSHTTKVGWELYLRDLTDRNQPIPPYASAALNDDFEGLPPAISFVGDMEPFRDETIAYIDGLKAAGIPVKFKLFKGAFHGFDMVAADSKIAQVANKFQFEAFAEYYDQFFGTASHN